MRATSDSERLRQTQDLGLI